MGVQRLEMGDEHVFRVGSFELYSCIPTWLPCRSPDAWVHAQAQASIAYEALVTGSIKLAEAIAVLMAEQQVGTPVVAIDMAPDEFNLALRELQRMTQCEGPRKMVPSGLKQAALHMWMLSRWACIHGPCTPDIVHGVHVVVHSALCFGLAPYMLQQCCPRYVIGATQFLMSFHLAGFLPR